MSKEFAYPLNHAVTLDFLLVFFISLFHIATFKKEALKFQIFTFFDKVELVVVALWKVVIESKLSGIKILTVNYGHFKPRFDFILGDKLFR